MESDLMRSLIFFAMMDATVVMAFRNLGFMWIP